MESEVDNSPRGEALRVEVGCGLEEWEEWEGEVAAFPWRIAETCKSLFATIKGEESCVTILDAPERWRFARAAIAPADCGATLLKLRKLLEARTRESLDDLAGYDCVELGSESSVYFHRIDVERAKLANFVIVHRVPAEEAAILQACAEVGLKHGYYEFIDWQAEGIHGQWRKREQTGQLASIAWEQWPMGDVAFDCPLWDALWQAAAKELGLEPILLKQPCAEYSIPLLSPDCPFRRVELGELGTSQVCDDYQGAMVVVSHEQPAKLGLRLAKIDELRARAIWAAGVRTMTGALGAAIGQTLNISYNGADSDVSERLNAILPVCLCVDYVTHENVPDSFFAQMFQPKEVLPGQLAVFPALALETADDLEPEPILLINVVRKDFDCWLEFQFLDTFPMSAWLSQVIGFELERWEGSAANRWEW